MSLLKTSKEKKSAYKVNSPYVMTANYTSIFHFHGHPILPPLISDDEKEMLRKYRQDALKYEKQHQEAKALKYSKLVGQVKDVLQRIEQNRKSKACKPSTNQLGKAGGVGQTLDGSRVKIPSQSFDGLSSYPISSTPFLHSSRSTDIHDLMASSIASTIKTAETDQSSVLDEYMDLPQAWNKPVVKMKENEEKSVVKSSAQRQLKMDNTWESSYEEYHKVFGKGDFQTGTLSQESSEKNPQYAQKVSYDKIPSLTSHAPPKDTQEQLVTTSVYVTTEENTIDPEHIYQEHNTTGQSTLCSADIIHQDDDHELSDKENSQIKHGKRYDYPSSFLKQNLDIPEVTTGFEDTLEENRQTEFEEKIATSQICTVSNNDEEAAGLAKNFARLTACAKGFLTRALFKTNKVQSIIKTIEDTWSFSEDILKDGPKSMQERALQERVSLQMKAAKQQLSDIFHKLPVHERMEMLAISRQLNRDKQISRTFKKKNDAKSNRLSAATMKAMQRRQQGGVNTGSEKTVKQEKHEKPEVTHPVNPKPKQPISIRKRTDLRVLKPIQSHSSPRLPPKTTKSTSTSDIGRINRKPKTKVQNSKHRGKSENVNTQVQTAAKQAAAKRIADAVDRKLRANTVPRTNNAVQRTKRQLPTRQLPVNRKIAASMSGNQP